LTESSRLWATVARRNDDGPLQGADRTSAASTRLRRPADRGGHRRRCPKSDACGRSPGFRSLPTRYRIAVRGWGHLALRPGCAPTPRQTDFAESMMNSATSSAADPVTISTFQQAADADTFSSTPASRWASCRSHNQTIQAARRVANGARRDRTTSTTPIPRRSSGSSQPTTFWPPSNGSAYTAGQRFIPPPTSEPGH
jgi:hypothetical protein